MRTVLPDSESSRKRSLKAQGSSASASPTQGRERWYSREYLARVFAKRPAQLLALLAFVVVAAILIYVFAAGQESTALTLCGSGGGQLQNTTCTSGAVGLSQTVTSNGYTWLKGGDDGGGRGNVAAIDPLNAGHAALGGDVWGTHTSDNYGALWTPRMWGANGIGQVYVRAVAYSIKNPGTTYWGIGTLKGGGGSFDTITPGSYQLQKTNTTYGFGTTQASGGGFTPRAVGKLITVDYDASSGIEYIYALTNKGLARSTDGGKNFTVLGLTSVPDSAWKALELAPDGSLYAANFGTRSSDTAGSGQQLWHITNPRGSASISTMSAPAGLVNDITTINGVVWMVTSSGVYKLSGGSWQSIPADSSTFNASGLTLSSIDGTGSTIFVGSGNAPAGSNHWVAKSTDSGATWAWVTPPSSILPNVEGTNRPFWLASKSLPGDAFGIEQLVVDPHNANFILMASFRGAYASTDGGAHWAPSVNGLDGTEVSNVKVGTGGQAWNNDTDWASPPGSPWNSIATTNHYCTVAGSSTSVTFGGAALTRTVGSNTYVVKWTGSAYDITKNGTSIATDYFRGAVENPTDLQVSSDGYIYLAQFGGGVLVGVPPGQTLSC